MVQYKPLFKIYKKEKEKKKFQFKHDLVSIKSLMSISVTFVYFIIN